MLCDNIKTRREALGLSQQQLADRLHVVRQTVSKWEQGLSVPDCDMLIRMAQQLQCSAAELLGQSGAETPDTDSLLRETQQLRQEAQQMAEELAELNEQYAQEKSGRIRRRRITAITVLALTLALTFHAAVRHAKVINTLGIIGGADGPTAIFVAKAPVSPFWWLLPAALISLPCAAYLIKTRKYGRKSKRPHPRKDADNA